MRLTVGIVTYNNEACLKECLTSLKNQSRLPDELLIWDNASHDQTPEILLHLQDLPFPLEHHLSDLNLGFGQAHNQLIQKAHGTHYLLLNPDVILAADFIEKALATWQDPQKNSKLGAINGLVLYLENQKATQTIYSCGHVMYKDRRLEDLGIGQSLEDYTPEPRSLFGFNGACAVISLQALQDVSYPEGPFDQAYFLYGEDDDLNWRMALAGWKTLFEPQCKAWHDAGSSGGFKNPRARRSALANRWINIVKNDHALLFLKDLPWIVLLEIFYVFSRMLKRPAFLLDLLGAKLLFLKLLGHGLKRRRLTPIRMSLQEEKKLLENGMKKRLATLWLRSTGRKVNRSLWHRSENSKSH